MPKVQISSPKLRQPNGVFSHATAIEATGRLCVYFGYDRTPARRQYCGHRRHY